MDGHSDPSLIFDECWWKHATEEQRQRYLIESGAIALPLEPEPSVGLFQQLTPDDLYISVEDTGKITPIPRSDPGPRLPSGYGLAAREEAVPNRAARRRAQRRHRS